MGFWSFMRDMFVFNWLFDHIKKDSFRNQHSKDIHLYDDHSHHDDYGDYQGYDNPYYPEQDFDDDLDTDPFDDDF